ncbi:5'/3'-nucleotidase SurE [bacterium]|nr:5'/3'-nucleotidase SurE [bacterium]
MTRILVTNDDGIHSPGIHLLAETLSALGEVHIVCPDRERSAVSHSFTMHSPLRVRKVRERVMILDGTPTDCVMFAILGYFEGKPDLVVSGINNGPNLGDDVIYSGTVAAAHEGKIMGIPSFALSLNCRFSDDGDPAARYLETAGRFALHLSRHILAHGLPPSTFLNVNVPNVPWEHLRGVAVTKLGQRLYNDSIIWRKDPHGKDYFWIGGEEPSWVREPGTDFAALEQNLVSITPLGQSLTHFTTMHHLSGIDFASLGLSQVSPGADSESDHEMAKKYLDGARRNRKGEA